MGLAGTVTATDRPKAPERAAGPTSGARQRARGRSVATLNGLSRFARSPAFPFATSSAVLVALFVAGALALPGFASVASVDSVLILASFLGFASVGETIAILLGGVDLAIPFIVDMSNVMAPQLAHYGVPFIAAAVIALFAGTGVGCFNGYVSQRLRIHPLIVTLGVGYAVQAAVEIWTKGAPSGISPYWLGRAVSIGATMGGVHIAPVLIVWAVLGACVIFGLRRTSFGRRIYAVGTNREAARLALVDPVRIWTVGFGVGGFFASLAGLLLIGSTGGPLATVGDSYLFLAVGAVVVGGTSLLGGRGGYGGTILGAVLITVLDTILVGLGSGEAVEELLVGTVIIAAVALFGRGPHVRDRV